MRASSLEFRLRMIIQVAIFVVGFVAPWIGPSNSARRVSTLAWLALEISRSGVASFALAAPMVIVLGSLAALAGVVFRVWGAAYLSYDVVHQGQMQGGAVMVDGPYRYVRNPLYLGGWCLTVAMSLTMPPSGALFTLVMMTAHFLRLILGEEAFLSGKLGEPYREYLRSVPRLVPRLRPNLPRAGAHPQWLVALVSEVTAIGIFVAVAFLSWTYDNMLMIKVVVISFGVALVVRAFMARREAKSNTD